MNICKCHFSVLPVCFIRCKDLLPLPCVAMYQFLGYPLTLPLVLIFTGGQTVQQDPSPSPSSSCQPPPGPLPTNAAEVMVNFDPDPADLALSSVPGQEAFDPRRHRFSDEELKPQPMIKKARKMLVPDEQKVLLHLYSSVCIRRNNETLLLVVKMRRRILLDLMLLVGFNW